MKKILKATAVLLIAAAFLFAAGCTENSEPIEKGQVLTEADNGKTLTLEKGENFTLSLKGNPSTGYSWKLDLSDGLSILSDEYSTDPDHEGEAGAGGIHSWVIETKDTGSQEIKGIYKRPWESTSDGEKTFTLTVEVV